VQKTDVIIGESCRRNRRGAAFVERRTMGVLLYKRHASIVFRIIAQSQLTEKKLEKGVNELREDG
jgi:hypothetical protein